MDNKFYITADKVGEFVSVMYAKGIRVDADPCRNEVIVHKGECEYEWIKVLSETSFEELCNAFNGAVDEENHE